MNRRGLIAIIFSVILFTSSSVIAEEPALMPHPISSSSRILVMGSSSMTAMERHFKKFASEENIPIAGKGIPGSRIDTWLNLPRFDTELRNFKPTHVVMYIGANDMYTQKSPETVSRQAQALFKKITDAGAIPVFIGIPELFPYYGKQPNEELRKVINETPEFLYPSWILTIPKQKDKLHATRDGYRDWANKVWDWMKT